MVRRKERVFASCFSFFLLARFVLLCATCTCGWPAHLLTRSRTSTLAGRPPFSLSFFRIKDKQDERRARDGPVCGRADAGEPAVVGERVDRPLHRRLLRPTRPLRPLLGPVPRLRLVRRVLAPAPPAEQGRPPRPVWAQFGVHGRGMVGAVQDRISVHQDRDLVSILELDYVFNIIPLLGGLVAALTQCYLTFRAGNFISNHRARYVFYGWMGLLVALALAGAGLVTGLGFLLNIRGGTTVLPLSWNSAACIWLSATATTDLSISLALAYSLRKRIKNFNGTTDSLLKQLIYLALRTAAYTAILSIAGLIVAAVYKDSDYGTTNIHIALWLPLPALYGSSVFTTITASRRAIAYSIGGVSTYPGPVASTGMTGINPLQSGRHSLTAVPPHLKRDSRRFSAFNGVVSGVPMRSPTPPAPAANRNSGKFSIKVVTEVERKEEREAYEEIRLTLGKRDSVARWLQKRDGEDEGDDEDEVLVDKEEKVDSLV